MKKISVGIILLLLSFDASFAQKYHTLAQIIDIMEKSKIQYEIGKNASIELPEEKRPVLGHGFYQFTENGEISFTQYKLSEGANVFFEKAEKYFTLQNDYLNAREQYLKALDISPDNSQLMTYIGQTYEKARDFENAKIWFQKAIDANYIDYMAHWFIADIYNIEKNKTAAIKEITIAHILNRNNQRLKDALLRIYKDNKKSFDEWEFKPECRVYPDGDKIVVEYNDYWLPYALCQALWKYEPGYCREMTGEDSMTLSTTRDIECLVNLLIGYKNANGKKIKDKPIIILNQALEDKQLTPFIIYEMWTLTKPYVVYNLKKELLEDMADYVIKSRGGK